MTNKTKKKEEVEQVQEATATIPATADALAIIEKDGKHHLVSIPFNRDTLQVIGEPMITHTDTFTDIRERFIIEASHRDYMY